MTAPLIACADPPRPSPFVAWRCEGRRVPRSTVGAAPGPATVTCLGDPGSVLTGRVGVQGLELRARRPQVTEVAGGSDGATLLYLAYLCSDVSRREVLRFRRGVTCEKDGDETGDGLMIKQVDRTRRLLRELVPGLWGAQSRSPCGGEPVGDHRWWLSNAQLQATDFEVWERERDTATSWQFAEYDQCDHSNLMTQEVISPYRQCIGYHYVKKRSASSRKDSVGQQGQTREDASYFSEFGWQADEMAGRTERVELVGKELGRSVAVQKQMREARETAELLRDGE